MRESGEWFSPRTRPEMLTSDDPPIPGDKPELVRILPGPATVVGRATAPLRRLIRILPGPATVVGRATAPLRRLIGIVPAIGRCIVRVAEDDPSRWQRVAMWTSGSAILAATGLAVATVLGGAPAALRQPFEQLTGLPGIGNEQSQPDAVPPAGKAATDSKRAAVPARVPGGSQSASGYTAGRSSVVYPDDLVPGRPVVPGASSAAASSGGAPAAGSAGNPASPPAAGGGTTAPAPPTTDPTAAPTVPPVTDPTGQPTDPGTTPTPDPTTPPTENPTDPAPTPDPTVQPTPDPTVEPTPEPTPVDPAPQTTSESSPDQPPPTPTTGSSPPPTA
jgi:hypothetical protein